MPDTALYDLADQLYDLAPWKWMSEVQIIELRHPETGESGYISIMGGNGEHLCLALYLGEGALHRFNLMQEAEFVGIHLGHADQLALILESRQLQLSFERRAELQAHELAEIKKLGRNYRGGNWPSFRSYRAGYAPMPVDADECVWLTHAITQLMEVAPALREDPSGDCREGKEGPEWLTRACIDGTWQTSWTLADDGLFFFPEPEPSKALAAKVKKHAKAGEVECAFELVPSPIGRDPKARRYPYRSIPCGCAARRKGPAPNKNLILRLINDDLKQRLCPRPENSPCIWWRYTSVSAT